MAAMNTLRDSSQSTKIDGRPGTETHLKAVRAAISDVAKDKGGVFLDDYRE